MARTSRHELFRSCLLLGACTLLLQLPADAPARPQTTPAHVPHLDHIVVIVMENHGYSDVALLPYISTLRDSGATCDDFHAEDHPSQPNYIAMWAGSQLGVTDDTCPAPGSPFTDENLGHACEAAGLTWKAYSENLPSPGYSGCTATGGYSRNHEPWVSFSNLDHANERPFSELALAESLETLPNLTFIIPNKCNDGHDCALSVMDNWLATYMPGLLRAVGPNGVVITTWDEDDHNEGNRILTLFNGKLIDRHHTSYAHANHYTLLRTICDALDIPPFGAAITESPIIDVWNVPVVSVQPRSWGTVKGLYR